MKKEEFKEKKRKEGLLEHSMKIIKAMDKLEVKNK